MNVRAHMSMLFHLDKCIGCHTCSIACKNLWTDRKGAEYMWWNNVETRPGSGYPTQWENQEHFKGGWKFQSDGYGEKNKLDLASAHPNWRAGETVLQPGPAQHGRLLRTVHLPLRRSVHCPRRR